MARNSSRLFTSEISKQPALLNSEPTHSRSERVTMKPFRTADLILALGNLHPPHLSARDDAMRTSDPVLGPACSEL